MRSSSSDVLNEYARRGLRIALVAKVALIASSCARSDFVSDRASCSECQIVTERIVVIGDTTRDNALTGRPYGVWNDTRGRYWINVLDAFPMLYDSGRGTLEPFGKPGGGPGEFRRPTFYAQVNGDSILLTDAMTIQIIAPDLTIARQLRRIPNLYSLAVLSWPTNVLCITAPYDQATRTTRTMIARYDFSRDSAVLVDTVLDTGPNRGRGEEWANSLRRLGQPTEPGDIWVSDYNRYRLVLYSSDGVAKDSVMGSPSWFPGGAPLRSGGPNQPSQPHMIGNWVDSSGHLWVFVAKPRGDWRKAWEGTSSPAKDVSETRVASLPADYKLYQTVIDVIDPSTKRVVARHTFDGYITAFLPGQRIASFVESSLGVPILRIDRLSLKR